MRFKPGSKLADNFYVRQDLTRAYYFTVEEIKGFFTTAGCTVVKLKYLRRKYWNRKTESVRYRVWIEGIFEKKGKEE